MKYKDIQVEDSYRCSLSKLVGKSIKDIHGIIAGEYGNPVFKLSVIVFDDDTELDVEGEHDFPYLTGEQPNYDCDTLETLLVDSEDEE